MKTKAKTKGMTPELLQIAEGALLAKNERHEQLLAIAYEKLRAIQEGKLDTASFPLSDNCCSAETLLIRRAMWAMDLQGDFASLSKSDQRMVLSFVAYLNRHVSRPKKVVDIANWKSIRGEKL